MKKHPLLLALFIAANLFLFSACDKNDDPDPKTKTQLLTQSSWKFKSATIAGNPYTSIPACQTDNIITFNSAGTGVVDEGATKCNAGDPQTNPFTWNFLTNETIIHLSTSLYSAANDFTIAALTETDLSLSTNYSPTPGGPVFQLIINFQH